MKECEQREGKGIKRMILPVTPFFLMHENVTTFREGKREDSRRSRKSHSMQSPAFRSSTLQTESERQGREIPSPYHFNI